jgi:hypothetical protein
MRMKKRDISYKENKSLNDVYLSLCMKVRFNNYYEEMRQV